MQPFPEITADEHDRQRDLYGPLTAAIRRLVDAGIRTGADAVRLGMDSQTIPVEVMAEAVPLSPGQQTVSFSVTVIWELG